jgi:hypothetical protein
LGGETPDGAAPARLTRSSSDGDPTPGSLELHVSITAVDQYVIAQAQVARNLADTTLHARIRLKSGSLNGAPVALHACTGSNFACSQGPAVDPAVSPGEWLSVQLDLGSITDPAFDATKVVSLGVMVNATISPDGTPRPGPLPAGSEGVLQIDTVTE